MKKNLAMLLQYDGSRYEGWQKQGNTKNTIQGKLETVLEKMTGTYQEIHGSGRTDAGVHAFGQIANVHLDTNMTAEEVCVYLNRYLPDDIRVLQVKEVADRFHSRILAKEKTYTYYIEMSDKCSVFQRKYVYTIGEKLNIKAMEQAAMLLCGVHDFKGFCTNKNKKKSTIRTVKKIEFSCLGTRLKISVTGDGFLYNMVRILVGTLIEIGQEKRTPESVKKILESGSRQEAGFTAPAQGLFLTSVVYEPEIFHRKGTEYVGNL